MLHSTSVLINEGKKEVHVDGLSYRSYCDISSNTVFIRFAKKSSKDAITKCHILKLNKLSTYGNVRERICLVV